MRISAAQRIQNENRIRAAMDRLLRGEIPPGGNCDVKTLAHQAGVDRTAFYGTRPAGDCVHTHHRLLGITWLPLGTTAHKQGRVAGENALGGHARFAGSLGTQVVKVFDLVAARTRLREHEALAANLGWTPATSQSSPDDHKAYYPGATPVHIRITGDRDVRTVGC